MTTRAEIADAMSVPVSGLDGQLVIVDGQPTMPATYAAWQGWPQWQSAEWLNRCVMRTTWQVLLVLPAGNPAAWAEATDNVLTPVRDGLETVGHVVRAEPVALASGDLQTQTLPALQFTLETTT